MTEFTPLAQSKRNKIFRIYQLKLIEKIILLKWEAFEEDYFFLITDLWFQSDSPEAEMGPAKWEYVKSNIKGHA